MTLLDIRKEFVKKSGRYDLVTDTTTWADNGANFYINAGHRVVDKMLAQRSKMTQLSVSLEVNEYEVELTSIARIIKDVEIIDSEGSVLPLEFKNLSELYSLFNKELADIDSGLPSYWTYKVEDTPASIRTLLIWPPTIEAIDIRVRGWFLLTDYSDDTDEDIWTNDYPEILLKAALAQLEVFYRNTEGYKDWMAAIRDEITLIDMEDVNDVVANINEMEG